MRRSPWITATRSGWIEAVRGRNPSGVSGAQFAAARPRPIWKMLPSVLAMRSSLRCQDLIATPDAEQAADRGADSCVTIDVLWFSTSAHTEHGGPSYAPFGPVGRSRSAGARLHPDRGSRGKRAAQRRQARPRGEAGQSERVKTAVSSLLGTVSRIQVNPPLSFISRAPFRNAASASRDSAPPTLMRLTPTPARSAAVSAGSAALITTLTGFVTDETTVRIVARSLTPGA